MVWFEKNAGGKKNPDVEPEKTLEAPKGALEAPPAGTAVKPEAAAHLAEPKPTEVAPNVVGYLYQGSRVSGQLSFQGPARIDGVVEGDIQCQGALTIGESAEVKAKISARQVVVRGKVEGNVSAKEKIELIAPARLIGDIDTPRLIITEGVVFDGDCSMGVAQPKGGFVDSHSVLADIAPVDKSAKAESHR